MIVNKSKSALDTIEDVMLNSEDDGHRLKAAQDLLNRGGMKQIQEISVTHTTTSSPSEIIMNKINSLVPSKRDDEDIVDAEITDSEEIDEDEQN